MPSSEPQHAAVTEAARIAAESSRRTVEDAKAAVEVTRDLIDTVTEVSRKVFTTWVAGTEASVKATFEVQNAGAVAGLAWFDAASNSERAVLKEWDAAAREVQKAALEAFQAQTRAAARLSDKPEPKSSR
jgi:hypothetical protein